MKTTKPFTSEVAYAMMPKSVRVGCYDFKFEIMSRRETKDSDEYGHCDYNDQTIRYSLDQPPQNLGNTILHETMHAVHWAMGLLDNSTEEDFTTRGANGLQMVWRDNPDLIAWLNRCFTESVHA